QQAKQLPTPALSSAVRNCLACWPSAPSSSASESFCAARIQLHWLAAATPADGSPTTPTAAAIRTSSDRLRLVPVGDPGRRWLPRLRERAADSETTWVSASGSIQSASNGVSCPRSGSTAEKVAYLVGRSST